MLRLAVYAPAVYARSKVTLLEVFVDDHHDLLVAEWYNLAVTTTRRPVHLPLKQNKTPRLFAAARETCPQRVNMVSWSVVFLPIVFWQACDKQGP